MKIHSLLSEILIFSIISIFYILYPIFSIFLIPQQNTLFENYIISPFIIIQLIISILIVWFYTEKNEKEKSILLFILKKVLPAFTTFCFIFLFSLIFKFISIKLNFNSNLNVIKPTNFLNWGIYLINFIIAAFFEEVIYRLYFPEIIINFFKIKSIYIIIIVELLTTVLFALGHLYMGILSCLFAGISHIFFRICYKRTKSVFPGTIVHFIYNIISLILL